MIHTMGFIMFKKKEYMLPYRILVFVTRSGHSHCSTTNDQCFLAFLHITKINYVYENIGYTLKPHSKIKANYMYMQLCKKVLILYFL